MNIKAVLREELVALETWDGALAVVSRPPTDRIAYAFISDVRKGIAISISKIDTALTEMEKEPRNIL